MTAQIERSHYWVFDEDQLAEALHAWLGPNRHLPTNVEISASIFAFLESDECAERGMRRGGDTDDSPARTD